MTSLDLYAVWSVTFPRNINLSCSGTGNTPPLSRNPPYVLESYADVAKKIIAKDGFKGLFGRGLATRLATNAVQGMMFSVVWKARIVQSRSFVHSFAK